jgi:hypothetical protein
MTAMAFDYVNDDKLSALPLALRQRMANVQQSRMDAGFTAKNGMTYKNAADRDSVNAAIDRRAI